MARITSQPLRPQGSHVTFPKNGRLKEGTGQHRRKCSKETKSDNREAQWTANVSGVRQLTVGLLTWPRLEIGAMQARGGQRRGGYWQKSPWWLWWKGWSCPRGSHPGKKTLTGEELLEIFPNIESTNDKMLEADPNLERICQNTEEMLTPHCKLYDDSKKASAVQTTLFKALQRRPTLILKVSNV